MRPDAKPEGLRQAMAWLHTWASLVLGWLLFAIFLTGTLSFFMAEINDWMRPELHRSVPTPQAAEKALDTLARIAPGAPSWTLQLPGDRRTTVQASWRPVGAAEGRAGVKRVELDAATGAVIEHRATRGAGFLYRFHFELHAMPRLWGRWIVGVATFAMLVAIVSGVITHKKIFTDFFTFRPAKGQRSWLDAHNAVAVMSLPFHLVITFSGLLLLMVNLMPWGIDAAYGGDRAAYNAERRGQPAAAAPESSRPLGPRRAPDLASAAPVTPMAPVAPMLALASQRWPSGAGSLVLNRPGTPRASLELREQHGRDLLRRGGPDRLVFDAVTGALKETPPSPRPGVAVALYNVLTAIHLGRVAGPAMRWLLFLSGLGGTLMVATGLVLWVVKRQPERRKLGRTPWGHRLVEVLNVSVLVGLPLAIATYFWANRLVPVEQAARADTEIALFFLAWLAAAVHAAARPHRRAWREQLSVAALLFGLLPLLNAATGGTGLLRSVAQGQWGIAGFDLAAGAVALLLAWAVWRLRHPPPVARRVAAARGAPVETSP